MHKTTTLKASLEFLTCLQLHISLCRHTMCIIVYLSIYIYLSLGTIYIYICIYA